jgi:hypothetical protein
MPEYRVSSGEFELTIIRGTTQQAAKDAIGTLRDGNFDRIKLGLFTMVTLMYGSSDADEEPVFFSTLILVRELGLNYTEGGN